MHFKWIYLYEFIEIFQMLLSHVNFQMYRLDQPFLSKQVHIAFVSDAVCCMKKIKYIYLTFLKETVCLLMFVNEKYVGNFIWRDGCIQTNPNLRIRLNLLESENSSS